MEDDDAETFELFKYYIYHNQTKSYPCDRYDWSTEGCQKFNRDNYRFYFLADRIVMPDLCDRIIDTVQYAQYSKDAWVQPENIQEIYANTLEDSPLRRYVVLAYLEASILGIRKSNLDLANLEPSSPTLGGSKFTPNEEYEDGIYAVEIGLYMEKVSKVLQLVGTNPEF
jgi:hypothetical protein